MALDFKRMATSAALLFACAATLCAAPRLQLSTVAVGPVLVGSNGTSQQVVEAANAGDGTLSLSVQTSSSWLAASVGASRACTTTSGSCFPINITVQPGSLPSGTYTEFVSVTDPKAIDSPQEISVTITVAGVPSSVSLYAAPGVNGQDGTPVSAQVYPASAVGGAASTQSGGNWLQFTLAGGGSFSFGTAYSIQATPLASMAPGSYTGAVALTGSSVASENKTVGVTFTITGGPIVQTPVSNVRITAYPGTPGTASVAFTNIGQGTLSISSASIAPGPGLPAGAITATASGGTVNLSADPGTLAPGVYGATLTISSNAANNGQVSVPVDLRVEAAGPLISQGGIVNIATYRQGESLAPGGIAAVFGDQLAPAGTSLSSPGVPLVKTLGGVQVLVNGSPVPLYGVYPGQINFQVPYETATGTATVQVVSSAGSSNIRAVQIASIVARIMPWPTYLVPGNYGIAVNYGDGSLALPVANQLAGYKSHPAKPGDLLVVYCLGLGQTNPGATTGAAGAAQAVPNVSVTFGGGFLGATTAATPLFAGLSGGVGLYQVNVYVPADSPLGATVPVTFNVNGSVSNFVYIPVSVNGQ